MLLLRLPAKQRGICKLHKYFLIAFAWISMFLWIKLDSPCNRCLLMDFMLQIHYLLQIIVVRHFLKRSIGFVSFEEISCSKFVLFLLFFLERGEFWLDLFTGELVSKLFYLALYTFQQFIINPPVLRLLPFRNLHLLPRFQLLNILSNACIFL